MRTSASTRGRRRGRGLVVALLAAVSLTGSLVVGGTPAVAAEASYSATQTIPVPPASRYAGSGGGDGWALALTSTAVYNVFHHDSSAARSPATCSRTPRTCWPTQDGHRRTRAAASRPPTQPGLQLDQAHRAALRRRHAQQRHDGRRRLLRHRAAGRGREPVLRLHRADRRRRGRQSAATGSAPARASTTAGTPSTTSTGAAGDGHAATGCCASTCHARRRAPVSPSPCPSAPATMETSYQSAVGRRRSGRASWCR